MFDDHDEVTAHLIHSGFCILLSHLLVWNESLLPLRLLVSTLRGLFIQHAGFNDSKPVGSSHETRAERPSWKSRNV